MRNHANENITEFEIRRARARRHEAVHSTPSTGSRFTDWGDEKGVLKFVSLSVILLLFSICYTKQLSDAEGIKAASSELVAR
jgi:hypothetical protein